MKNLNVRSIAALVIGMGLVPCCSIAATFSIVNADDPGVGLNDPTPVDPLPSNPGKTLGEQRLFVLTSAANRWGQLLESTVEIVVSARFLSQSCLSPSGTSWLGNELNFPNAPFPDTFYPSALANSYAGFDLDPLNEDIGLIFNSFIDSGGCGVDGWSYATEPSGPVQGNRKSLMAHALRELATGLGFRSMINHVDGSFPGDLPGIYSRFVFDLEANLGWQQMTDAQRRASLTNDPHLVWIGANVTSEYPLLLGHPPAILIHSPAAIAGQYYAREASFGPVVPELGIAGNIVLAQDDVEPFIDACEPPINSAEVLGNIALIHRGNCPVVQAVMNVQTAGATGALIAYATVTQTAPLRGFGPDVAIASFGIELATSTSIRDQLDSGATVNATMSYDTSTTAGTNGGFVRLWAPYAINPGSDWGEFWTFEALPNLLKEPVVDDRIVDQVGLTLALLRDIGWKPVSAVFLDGFE